MESIRDKHVSQEEAGVENCTFVRCVSTWTNFGINLEGEGEMRRLYSLIRPWIKFQVRTVVCTAHIIGPLTISIASNLNSYHSPLQLFWPFHKWPFFAVWTSVSPCQGLSVCLRCSSFRSAHDLLFNFIEVSAQNQPFREAFPHHSP